MINRRDLLKNTLGIAIIPTIKLLPKQENKEEYLAKVIDGCEKFIQESQRRWPDFYLTYIDVPPDTTTIKICMSNRDSLISEVFTSRDTYIEDMNDRLNLVQHLWKYGPWNKNHDIFYGHFQKISVSKDFHRSDINELGKEAPYIRYASFPVRP